MWAKYRNSKIHDTQNKRTNHEPDTQINTETPTKRLKSTPKTIKEQESQNRTNAQNT